MNIIFFWHFVIVIAAADAKAGADSQVIKSWPPGWICMTEPVPDYKLNRTVIQNSLKIGQKYSTVPRVKSE